MYLLWMKISYHYCMPKGWSKGLTKETDSRVRRISATMRERGLDNFKQWRDEAKRAGKIKSEYPDLVKDGDLAELIGVTLGDGHICRHERCESLRIVGNSNNLEFALRYAAIIERVFSKRPAVAKRKNSNAITVTFYERNISSRLDIPTGNRKDYPFVLPNWIRSDRSMQIRFLRGLYEAEGSLCHHAPTYTHKLLFANLNPHLLQVVFELVSGLGFTANISGPKVQVSRKAEVQNLADLLEFRHYE